MKASMNIGPEMVWYCSVEYPQGRNFLYSPQKLRFRFIPKNCNNMTAVVVVSVWTGSDSSKKMELVYELDTTTEDPQEIDLRRAFQIAVGEPRLDFNNIPTVRYTISVNAGAPYVTAPIEVTEFFGALGPGETFSIDGRLKIFTNYPQTVRSYAGTINGNIINPSVVSIYNSYESVNSTGQVKDFPISEIEYSMPQTFGAMRDGNEVSVRIAVGSEIRNGVEYQAIGANPEQKWIPDNTPLGEGVFLRWLGRFGEPCYYLFRGDKLTVSSAKDGSFIRPIIGEQYDKDKNEAYLRAELADYSETRQMSVGARVQKWEWDWLQSLASSPVVERYVGAGTWEPVTVEAASRSRSIRFNTEKQQYFEVVLTLPKRDTAKW